MIEIISISFVLFFLSPQTPSVRAFAAGKGFGKSNPSNNPSFVSFDRFRSTCPADVSAIRQFDPSLTPGDVTQEENNDVWVAVYRSSNNLPSVFVRDAFFDAMAVSTTSQEGDSETLVSSTSFSSTSVASGVMSIENSKEATAKPVAVARLSTSSSNSNIAIIDSMRCTLNKENTDPDCDGGSEHVEAIGVCIDELVLAHLQKYVEDKSAENQLRFDGGIRFRGTLVSGKLLEDRGFREVNELSSDMHSHESCFDGALNSYAERSASKDVAKNPGARDRALKIVSYLAKIDREDDRKRAGALEDKGGDDDAGGDEDDESDFDPWASMKKYL